MITRELAGQLYGNAYRLVDNDGKVWVVNSVIGSSDLAIWSNTEQAICPFSKIGIDYFILARPYEQLTKEIEPGVVPLVEAAKISKSYVDWTFKNERVVSYDGYSFWFFDDCLNITNLRGDESYIAPKQNKILSYLMRLHFPINLPDGTWKEITI